MNRLKGWLAAAREEIAKKVEEVRAWIQKMRNS